MATTPVNHAAVIPHACGHPMRIETVTYPTVGENELVIRPSAIAVNPIDWKIQTLGDDLFPFLQYPLVVGSDIAGIIVEVGPGAASAKFSVGDRVLAFASNMGQGAFQKCVAVHANFATKIPGTLSFTDAAVLPLGVATAASALFGPEHLQLALPTLDTAPKSRDQVVLIWGGATSVGTNAIQLAVASGYEVFTTCSPHNFELCRSLGASQVFDYKSAAVVADIVAALSGKTIAGAVAIVPAGLDPVYEIVRSSEVKGTKKVAFVISTKPTETHPTGIELSDVYASTVKDNGVGVAIFHDYLQKALAKGTYQAQPSALVVGQGLEAVQSAVDQDKDAKPSAKKLVVTLEW